MNVLKPITKSVQWAKSWPSTHIFSSYISQSIYICLCTFSSLLQVNICIALLLKRSPSTQRKKKKKVFFIKKFITSECIYCPSTQKRKKKGFL